MTRFLLIRHAQTDALGKYLSGRAAGVPLNAAGFVQAEVLARRLELVSLAAVYTSPLDRAVQTAAPLAASRGMQPRTATEFLEIDFGEWTGLSFAALGQDQRFRWFNSFRSNAAIPGGETMAHAQLRVVEGLQRLAGLHPNQTVAVVSHSDIIKAALAFYAGMPLDMMQRWEVGPASVSVVDIFDETARILFVNHTGVFEF